jgi:lipopolysaccharide transport system ATP-binding protein
MGSVHITGRVAALLELGMGFHPDFTGRQNAIMAGQLLGFSAEEVAQLMPAIEAFAEIGDYMDLPVRIYSSGMQMRLAFSVATARRPEVLIVDEALSVGDTYFQHKSFDRIREFRKQGTTLLIVSHDKAAIQSLCDHAILLNAGRLAMQGAPEEVMDYYNAMLAEKENRTVRTVPTADNKLQTISGTGEATITDIGIKNGEGDRVELIEAGAPVVLEISVSVKKPLPTLVLGFLIKDRLGQPVFGTNTRYLKCDESNLSPCETLTYRFEFDANLGVGTYSVATALANSETHLSHNYEWRDLAMIFQVVNSSLPEFVGTTYLPTRTQILRGKSVHA